MLELPDGADVEPILRARREIERAIADVLARRSRERRVQPAGAVTPGSTPRPVVWLRAWFRYLRQTGSRFGLVTVVDALRRAPKATRGADRPVRRRPRSRRRRGRDDGDRRAPARRFDEALAEVARDRRRPHPAALRALVEAILRTNAFAPAAAEALAFKINSALVPGLPAPVPWREIWVYSARASRASTCAAARSPAAACAGPTGATISAPRSSA